MDTVNKGDPRHAAIPAYCDGWNLIEADGPTGYVVAPRSRVIIDRSDPEQAERFPAALDGRELLWVSASGYGTRSITSETARVGLIKAEAHRRIIERFPEWKQRNMTARGLEIRDAIDQRVLWLRQQQLATAGTVGFPALSSDQLGELDAVDPVTLLTADEATERAAIKAAWEWVKAVRVESDRLETEGLEVSEGQWPV